MFFLRTLFSQCQPLGPCTSEFSCCRVQEWASVELELGSASLINSPGHSREHQSLGTTALGHVSWRDKQENWAINTCLMHVSNVELWALSSWVHSLVDRAVFISPFLMLVNWGSSSFFSDAGEWFRTTEVDKSSLQVSYKESAKPVLTQGSSITWA